MALRLGVKISSVAGQSVTPIRFRRQFQSLSPVASFKISPNQRAASGIVPANKKSSKQSITKNADKNQKYSTKDRVTRDFNEYNAVEQYELEAAKPREKMHRVNRVYEFMSKLQQNQNWRILPHLQPSNLRPYGSTDNIIFPESLRQRDLIKYPQEDEVLAEVEEEMSEKSVQQYSKDEFTNRRDYSTFEKKHNHKNDHRKMATKSKHIEEENVSLGASEVNKESLNKFDSVSEETKSEKNKIWPSYSDILRHEINKDVMTTSTRKLHQSCNPLGPSAQRPVPLSEMNVGLNLNEAIKEPKIKSTILTDPINEVEIREPELKPMAMKLKKGKKPKESWDQYCPEEEEIIIKRECPIIPRKLPKLIPRDCPCVEPPPPCDVPPLPRLDLEVCEPRPECPIHPCETTPRADIDCWEYMESPEVDCRVIPVKRKGECNKCEMKRRKDKNRSSCPYSTSAFKGDMQSKRQYSSLTAVSTDYENVTKIVPDFIIPIPSVQRHVDENTQINNDILFDNFATFGRNLNNSTSTPVLLNKLGSIQADMISRQYSTNDERCIKKPKKDCKLPPADNCNACKHGKEKKCTRECPTFCMHDCPPANPRGTECIPRHEVCCEKAQTPYPSYSECLVSYLAPFTNFPNYKCIKCPKRDNPGFYYKKFSTMAAHHNGANSSLFSSHCKSVKGKRVFSTHVRKPLLSTPAKFRKSGIRNKHKKKNPCKLCVDISYPNCPPRCRFTCDKDPIDDNCTKRNSPYPSFSECVIEELDEYISECPYNLEATHRLQPKYEMLSKMAYLIKHLPAPGFKPFDPLKEEKCIRSKLCIKNDGVSQCCNDFGKPHAALKNKDFFEPNDRTQCKFLTNKQEKQDSRKIKRKYHTKTLNTNSRTFLNFALTTTLFHPHFRLFSSTSNKNCKSCPKFDLENCIRCEDKKKSKLQCSKRISPYPSFSEINQSDCEPEVITECPDGDYQDKREKKIKSQFNIPGLNEYMSLKNKSNCNKQPSLCSHTNQEPEEPQACQAESLDESCINLQRISPPPPGKFTFQQLWCNIKNYFKARDCPSPEEFKRMRLREVAEKAARDAGLCLCDPKELKTEKKEEPLPKIITPDCCVQKNEQE